MNLVFRNRPRHNIVTVEAEVLNFTPNEIAMLNQLKEPVIVLEKTYGSNTVKINRRLKPGFHARARFNLALENDSDITVNYIEQFKSDLVDAIESAMSALKDQYCPELACHDESFKLNY